MTSRLRFLILTLLLTATALVAASVSSEQRAVGAPEEIECMEDPLGPAPDWTVAVHGDLSEANTYSEGRVAVGGTAALTNFEVATKLPEEASRIDLAVGGNLNATHVNVEHGSVTYGGSLKGKGDLSTPHGTIIQQPLDLDALFQEGQRRAEAWRDLEPNGEISGPEAGALSLTGTAEKLNVFRIDAARLEGAARILLRVPFGSSILVNVLGASYSTGAEPRTVSLEFWDGSGYVQFGNDAPSAELETLRRALLWNFAEASTVQIGPQLAWHGSILAPDAAFTLVTNTEVNGTIIAGSLHSNGVTNLHPPDHMCLPEPGTEPPKPPEPPPPTPEPPPPGPEPPPPEPPPGPEPPPTEPPPGPEPPPPGPGPVPPPPSPEPAPEPVIPPFVHPPEHPGPLPDAHRRTDFEVIKQILNRRGRPVELLKARPGQLVRFRLFGYNLGFVSARGVVACDRVPRGLRLVKAPGDPTFRDRRLCWRLGTVDTQRHGIVTFRVRRSICGRVINRLVVRSRNGGRDEGSAQVSACRRAQPRTTG